MERSSLSVVCWKEIGRINVRNMKMIRSKWVWREGERYMSECLVGWCLKSILEDTLIVTQLSIRRILLKAFLGSF